MNDLLTRLREQFEAQYEVADNDCWLWTGPIDADGYGHMMVLGGSVRAHRLSYELYVGPVSEGLVLDHLCRSRACVNYAHLESVTSGENVLRGESPSAQNARKSQCVNGHPFDEENTYAHNGERHCRECRRIVSRNTATERQRRYRARSKVEV